MSNDQSLDVLQAMLSKVPESIAERLLKERAAWRAKQKRDFDIAAERMQQLRSIMNNPNEFVALDIHAIDAWMAFLSSYYHHVVELEGIAMGRKAINERVLRDNVFFLKNNGAVEGRSFDEYKAQAVALFPELKKMEQEIISAQHDLSLLGVGEHLTSRASSIKMLIEVLKKRHDALAPSHKLPGAYA